MVTGVGSGMGRELTRQLAAQGCWVAGCDLNPDTMAETVALAQAEAPSGSGSPAMPVTSRTRRRCCGGAAPGTGRRRSPKASLRAALGMPD